MKAKTNIRVRVEMLKHGTAQWKLAELLGVSESTMRRMLRKELPEAEQDRIIWVLNNQDKYKEMCGKE